ncbi:MAG: hypothetical protein L0H29_11430, partial [Sinobacteraceae bacterium]|nr:hypothetical protein [Nevskiaceae bacterium]
LLLTWSAVWAMPGIFVAIWLYHHWSSIYTLLAFVLLTAAALALFMAMAVFGWHAAVLLTLAIAALLVGANGVIAILVPYATEIYPGARRATGAGGVAAVSKAGGICGAGLGVAGLFAHMAAAAIMMTVLLLVSALLLWRYGVDTRGLRLEEIADRLHRRRPARTLD